MQKNVITGNSKSDGMSMDIKQTEINKLKDIFPQCFSEGKLDVNKLLSVCGEYADNNFEKYKFEWNGKAKCLRLAQKRSTGTLRPCIEESVNFDSTQNLYIEGDNLEVLKLLQTAYYNKIKMIYIDPPYNTGNDFVYEDNFADPMARYKEITHQVTKSNPETMGRYHTNWLNMIYPRLILAGKLLTDDGVIFISIDDNEVFNLKKLCDEVFGEENFVSTLIWERAFSPKNDAKFISSSHDYVLMYAKNINKFEIGRLERTDAVNSRYKNPDNDPRGVWLSGDLTTKTYSAAYDYGIITPSGKEVFPTSGRSWNTSKEHMQKLIEDNRIWFGANGSGTPRYKRFLSELEGGMAATSMMYYKDVGHSQEGRQELKKLFDNKGYFDGPKPVRLIKRLAKIANLHEASYVLDFFSGSASTAEAILQMNAEENTLRKFIMVQLPELLEENKEALKDGYKNICEIGKERIRRAGTKILDNIECKNVKCRKQGELRSENSGNNSTFDVGFKVFKLDSSNLKIWDSTPIIGDNRVEVLTERMNSMINSIKDDRTDMDVVYEIMLKMGIPLTEPVRKIKLTFGNDEGRMRNGTKNSSHPIPNPALQKVIYAAGDFLLLIALYNNITAEDIEQMAAYSPSKIVCAEQGFTDDTALSNAYYILRDKSIELKLI